MTPVLVAAGKNTRNAVCSEKLFAAGASGTVSAIMWCWRAP
jgi:hypothetical protein